MNIKQITLDVAGTIKVPDEESPGMLKKVVFQGTGPQFANYRNASGKPKMQRAYVIPTDPMTPAQQNQRMKLSLAVQAWQEATPEQRAAYEQPAKERQITVYMAFISAFIKELPPTLGTLWDDGATSWLDGTTTTLWDI